MKFFYSAIIILVLLVVGAGMFVIGSPQEERARRFDDIRIGNLQQIQSQVYAYFQVKQLVPNMLIDMAASPQELRLPRDPETNKEYEYSKKSDTQFELCAVFSKVQRDDSHSKYYPPMAFPSFGLDAVWKHEAGRVCFLRTIDKDYFKKTPLPPLGY